MLKYQKEKITLMQVCRYLMMGLKAFIRNNKYQGSVWSMVAFLLLMDCSTNENKPSDAAYFPLKVGNTWIYNIEETAILRAACTDDGVTISNYEMRVVVADSFPDTDQSFTYLMQRSKRLKTTDAWTELDTWTSSLSGGKIINNESNINFVKLVIPIADNIVWNGNQYNNRLELNGLNVDEYKATLVGQPYTNPSAMNFTKTVSVVQNDQQKNLLYRDSRLEVYAFGVGLVYKESYLLNYFDKSDLPCYGTNKTQKGTIYKQSLKEFIPKAK
jgi:hypothetical protein